MFSLVSLERVKQALRISSEDEDATLAFYISAASRAVTRYLKGQAGELLGIDSPPNSPPDDPDNTVPEDIQMAVILLVGIYYREPDGDDAKNFERGYLPKPVTALLYPLRDPTIA